MQAKVGELKNQLSAYLKQVRQGSEVVILDRETPIGRIVPYSHAAPKESFEMAMPIADFKKLSSFKFRKRKKRIHAVDALIAERHSR